MKTTKIDQTYKVLIEEDTLKKKRKRLDEAISKLLDVTSYDPDLREDHISETILFLEKKKELMNADLEEIFKKILIKQQECDHVYADGSSAMDYEGYYNHHNYYKCQICAYTTKS